MGWGLEIVQTRGRVPRRRAAAPRRTRDSMADNATTTPAAAGARGQTKRRGLGRGLRAQAPLVRVLRAVLAGHQPPVPPLRDEAAWRALVAQTSRCGLFGLFSGPGAVAQAPDAVAADAERDRLRAVAEHRLATLCLAEATAALDEPKPNDAALPFCVLKGPPLGRLYPDGWVRRSTDLDLLVSEADLDRAIAVLGQIGYAPDRRAEHSHRRSFHHDVLLSRPVSPPIELHFRAAVWFGRVLLADALLSTTPVIPRRLPDVLAPAAGWPVPDIDAEVAYLAAHAASHAFEKVTWLLDLAWLLDRRQEARAAEIRPAAVGTARVDAARVLALAEAWQMTTPVLLALENLRRELGVLLPPRLAAAARRFGRSPRARAIEAAREQVDRHDMGSPRRFAAYLTYRALLCPTPHTGWAQVRYRTTMLGLDKLAKVAPRRFSHARPSLPPWRGPPLG